MIKKIKKYKKDKQKTKIKIKIKKNHIIYYFFHHLFLLQIYLHHFIKDIIFMVFFLYVLQ